MSGLVTPGSRVWPRTVLAWKAELGAWERVKRDLDRVYVHQLLEAELGGRVLVALQNENPEPAGRAPCPLDRGCVDTCWLLDRLGGDD